MGLTFDKLNQALNEVILGGRFESRPLYLVLDNQGRERVSSILGLEYDEVEDGCCSIVGSRLAKVGNPFADFELELWSWIFSGRQAQPPFTALLFTLSHAAELMASDGEFSSGNYYNRLSALVGISPQKLSQHGRSTEQFWKAFNSWLADNDFAYGRPTARAINAYKYVSIAMSQAIVREADRQRFHLMFEKYGFTNTDFVSTSEIDQYISTWILSSQPTRQLKEAWKKTELRPWICEAAVSEFEEWQSRNLTASAEGAAGVARLSLALSIRHDFFGRSAALYFGKEQTLERLPLALVGGGELELSNTTFSGFATLEPRSAIPLARSLLHGLELETDGKKAFKWAGRPAIPFSRSDQGYWSEVSRVSLGTEHLVLVRDDNTVRRAIEAALEEAAAPGYTVATAEKLKGMPPGWVLYENVVIARALAQLKGFEAVLSPVGDASSLRLEGGIKLGRGIYHRRRAPMAYLDADKPGVAITVWEGTSPDGSELRSEKGKGSSLVLDLSDCVPESGNIFIEGKIGRGTVASASLLFRSADRPRPLNWQEKSVVSYRGIISTSLDNAADGLSVRGLCIPGYPRVEFGLGILGSYAVLETFAPYTGSALGPQDTQSTLSRARELAPSIRGLPPKQVLALPCAERGIHVLVYAMVPPGAPKHAPVDVKCPDCGITFVHRREQSAAATPGRQRARLVVPSSPDCAPETAKKPIDADLWLDGACFIGAGSATVFETFAASEGVDSWRAGPVLRDLAWLGHLDVETGSTHRPRNWSVSPPTLSMTRSNSAVLCGFRCDMLIEKLRCEVETHSGQLVVERQENRPSVVRIEGLDADQLAGLAAGLRDPLGRHLQVVVGAPEAILSFLFDRGGFASIFRPATLGSGVPVQRYDVTRNRWRNAEHVQGAGAYRVSEAGTSYVYLSPAGSAFSAPHEIVKLAAARAAGVKLHAYDADTESFTCRLGCEPLGLLGRALVACEGRLPVVDQGITTFSGVRQAVAAGVLEFLYTGELPA